MHVTAVDSARYAEVFAALLRRDRRGAGRRATLVDAALRDLAHRARCRRIRHRDVLRAVAVLPAVQRPAHRRDPRRDRVRLRATRRSYPVLLTSLIEAADRVDSTTGVQMAYVKKWAPRSFRPLELACAGAARRSRPCRARRRVRAGRRAGLVRLRVSRSAVQPAPLLHQLPHLGDAGRVGRAGALRRRVQARRRARPRDAQPVQRAARAWPTHSQA